MSGVLFFWQSGRMEIGQTQTFLIPATARIGGYSGGKGLVYYREETFTFDFSGTTTEVTLPPAAPLESATLDGSGWSIKVRCDQEYHGALSVRIMAGADVRYQDAFGLHCFPTG
jgi:hypothetical protein